MCGGIEVSANQAFGRAGLFHLGNQAKSVCGFRVERCTKPAWWCLRCGETIKIVTTARLISSTGASSRRYATLSAGAQQGVTLGQPVRSAEGLVGRVLQRGQFVSRILLITDNANIVPVKRVTDGVPALAIGLGDGRIELRPLAAGTNPFAVGDVFVTSGTGGIYQPNIPVAVGVQRGRDRTVARPLANPDSLDFAVVERVYVIPPPALPVTTSEAPN